MAANAAILRRIGIPRYDPSLLPAMQAIIKDLKSRTSSTVITH